MRFDLTDLRLFVHVVEAGSITRGAERMHLAIAAASTRIRNMEEVLGTPLLHRERQGIQPTEAGRTLLHHARVLLQQAERMRGDLAEYADGLRGQVRLMSNTNALTEFLPEPLSAFLAAHPQVNIDLEERLSDEIVAAVAEGTADVGIVAGTVAVTGLEVLPFRVDRFVLVVARNHPLASLPPPLSPPRAGEGQGGGPPRLAFSRRSTPTSSVWTERARCSGFCLKRPKSSVAALSCGSSCAALMPSAASSNAMSGSGSSRRQPPSDMPRPCRSTGSS